jgi:Spy/CpxP family protein refolding chaperone
MKNLLVQLVVVLFFAFVFSGMASAQTPPPPGRNPHPMMQRTHKASQFRKAEIFKKLKLTDEQKQKIADLRINFQKNMIDLRANLQKDKLALKELKVKGDLNRDDVIAAVKKINSAKGEIAVAVANHMLDVYQLLTPDQQKILKDSHFNFGMHRGGRMNFKGGMGMGMMQGGGMMMHRNAPVPPDDDSLN